MNFFAPIILLVASVGLFFGYINPTYTAVTGSVESAGKSIVELQSLEKDYNDALTKTKEIERSRSGLSMRFDALKPQEVEKLEKLLPDHIDTVRLIIDINSAASIYGMSLSGIALAAPGASSETTTTNSRTNSSSAGSDASKASTAARSPDNALYGSVSLSFNVSGSYENFLFFLKKLETSLRVVDVTSLSFKSGKIATSADQPQVNPNHYSYSMSIRTYYLK